MPLVHCLLAELRLMWQGRIRVLIGIDQVLPELNTAEIDSLLHLITSFVRTKLGTGFLLGFRLASAARDREIEAIIARGARDKLVTGGESLFHGGHADHNGNCLGSRLCL